MTLDRARAQIEAARQALAAGEGTDRAAELFADAASAAHAARANPDLPIEARHEAAQHAIDAIYLSAMLPRVNVDESSALLRDSVLDAISVFETEEFDGSLRLYGLYVAQCSAFELAHRSEGEEAERLFADVVACADQASELADVEPDKSARLAANGAAAAHTLAGLKRDRGVKSYTDDLIRASELGSSAIRAEGLPATMAAETRLVLAEVTYELAITETEPESALPGLRNALGWARTAAEAEGVDGLFQAQALLRSADIASILGLALRHSDFEGGVSALLGAAQLAVAAAEVDEAPATIRGPAYDTAVRTLQNVGLLTKVRAPHRSRDAFERGVEAAVAAVELDILPGEWRAKFQYLAASGSLELATLLDESPVEREAALRRSLGHTWEAVGSPHAEDEVKARAALVGCGASGRLLELVAEDPAARARELEAIEALGRIAAECAGAPEDLRAKGRHFALDAAKGR